MVGEEEILTCGLVCVPASREPDGWIPPSAVRLLNSKFFVMRPPRIEAKRLNCRELFHAMCILFLHKEQLLIA